MRPLPVTLAVAALLVLAGCSAGGDTTTTSVYDTDVEPVYETPLDAETVTASHVDALRTYGTFTVEVNATWREDNGGRTARETLIRANLDTGAVYEHEETPSGVEQTYRFGNGTAYARTVSSGEVSYDAVYNGIGNATATARGMLPIVVEWFSFTYAGVNRVDGERVHVYRASGAEQFVAPSDPAVGENATIHHAAATLQFHEDGSLHRLGYTLEYERDHGSRRNSLDLRFQRLGDTDASPPLWIPAARNATD